MLLSIIRFDFVVYIERGGRARTRWGALYYKTRYNFSLCWGLVTILLPFDYVWIFTLFGYLHCLNIYTLSAVQTAPLQTNLIDSVKRI